VNHRTDATAAINRRRVITIVEMRRCLPTGSRSRPTTMAAGAFFHLAGLEFAGKAAVFEDRDRPNVPLVRGR